MHLLSALVGALAFVPMMGAQTTAVTYQGRLSENGELANGTYDFEFLLHELEDGSSPVGPPLTSEDVAVSNGLFTVALDFGPNAFDGSPRWLEIGVRTGLSTGAFILLTPLQAVRPSPYALYSVTAASATSADQAITANSATSMPWSGLTGVPAGFADGMDADTTYAAGTGLDLAGGVFSIMNQGIGSAQLANASISEEHVISSSFDTLFWKASGNMGTTAGTNFVGTLDNQPLELKVDATRALRLEPTSTPGTVNVIGGAEVNGVKPGVIGATIGGGGSASFFGSVGSNIVGADFSTIGGGLSQQIGEDSKWAVIGGGSYNTIGTNAAFTVLDGGQQNSITSGAGWSSIGGGGQNLIDQASGAVIGGGVQNVVEANASYGAISGGQNNRIATNSSFGAIGGGLMNVIAQNSPGATIAGGLRNTINADADSSTVLGGSDNSASGPYGLAAGRQAKADHEGAFVWADSAASDFSSTKANQFSVRAGGGVRIETGGVGMTLDGEEVLAGMVSSASLAADSVTDREIAAGAVGTSEIANNSIRSDDLDFSSLETSFWKSEGNSGTSAGVHFVGTTDDQPLEFKVSGQRALRLEPNTSDAPNLIGGSPVNTVDLGVIGATIGGGGYSPIGEDPYPNRVFVDFGTISGGMNNQVGGRAAAIGGGMHNFIHTNSAWATIGGGISNTNQINAPTSTIAGGSQNTIGTNASSASIGGGHLNAVMFNSVHATIAGGSMNSIADQAGGSTIGGGDQNAVGSHASGATIAGGIFNSIGDQAYRAVVGGGQQNSIESGAYTASVGGGAYNLVGSDAAYAAIGGGQFNTVETNGTGGTISGGYRNQIEADSSHATIGGGSNNAIESQTLYSTIGGGLANTIQFDADYTTVSGGSDNLIQPDADFATIGGGRANTISTNTSGTTISGGYQNAIGEAAFYATISGGIQNTNQAGAYQSTIGGGWRNLVAADARLATIPGGAEANADKYGQLAYAAGGFPSTPGSAQSSLYLLRNTTGNSLLTELYLDGSKERLTLPVNGVWTFDLLVVGSSATGESAGYQVRGVIENHQGTTTLVGPALSSVLAEDDATWNVVVSADDIADALRVRVNGDAIDPVRWAASVRTVEVIH